MTFEGKRGQAISYDPISSPEELVLGFGDSHLILYGYLRDNEFMEVDRESID